jgi:RHS repeat-associated protein
MTRSALCSTNRRLSRTLSTGKERDTESGNDYFEARYYSSAMGRFMSPDWSAKVAPVPYAKMDDPQTLNLYAYVGNNPLIHVDADGHWEISLTGDEKHKQFVAKPSKEGDSGSTLAKQLGLKGKDAKAFAKGVGQGDFALSKDKGSAGTAFRRMESIVNDAHNSFRDCSQSSADVAWGPPHNGMTTVSMDSDLQSHASPVKGGAADATSGDVVRYADSSNTPQHFASFMYTNDSGTAMVFSVSGAGGPKLTGPASDFQGVQGQGGADYGNIRGINAGESGYYHPE